MAISDYKEQIREIVVSGKEYLADNDLSGFYDHVMTKGSDAEIISGVWDFMENVVSFSLLMLVVRMKLSLHSIMPTDSHQGFFLTARL